MSVQTNKDITDAENKLKGAINGSPENEEPTNEDGDTQNGTPSSKTPLGPNDGDTVNSHANGKKFIVAITGAQDTGKTGTLRELANILIAAYPKNYYLGRATLLRPNFRHYTSSSALPPGDFRLIIEINGKWVAIESKGDPNSDLQGRLKQVATATVQISNVGACELIFCAARHPSKVNLKPVAEVQSCANPPLGYRIIWASTVPVRLLPQSPIRSFLCVAGPYRNTPNSQTDQRKAAYLDRLGASLGFYP
jgi:hypothetical protein